MTRTRVCNAKGYHVIYREFAELGARTYHPPSNDDAIAWATRLRNKNLPLSAGETELLKKFTKRNGARVNAQGYYSDLALVGGKPAGASRAEAARFRQRGGSSRRCRNVSSMPFSTKRPSLLSRSKLVDSSPKVRRAAIRALASNANWRSETAQKALVDFALSPEKALAPEDRVAAVDGIVQAARLQINGARQDPLLFQALITLLEDKDEELGTMAANTLAPIRDPEFRGDLGRPEQKAPEGGWQQWLDETSAKAAGYRKDYDACAAAPAAGGDDDP